MKNRICLVLAGCLALSGVVNAENYRETEIAERGLRIEATSVEIEDGEPSKWDELRELMIESRIHRSLPALGILAVGLGMGNHVLEGTAAYMWRAGGLAMGAGVAFPALGRSPVITMGAGIISGFGPSQSRISDRIILGGATAASLAVGSFAGRALDLVFGEKDSAKRK